MNLVSFRDFLKLFCVVYSLKIRMLQSERKLLHNTLTGKPVKIRDGCLSEVTSKWIWLWLWQREWSMVQEEMNQRGP